MYPGMDNGDHWAIGMGMVAIAVITVTRCVLVQGEKSLTKKSLAL